MANTHTSLTGLFSDIADAIRLKTGDSSEITADDFPDAIAAIQTKPEEPYVEYAYDSSGNVTAAKLYGFTNIPNGMFAYMTNLTSVDFSESPSLATIGQYAFYGCTSLALTSLPSGVTNIESNAFNGCTSLALTSLPSGVTNIGNRAFYGCTGLALTSLSNGLTEISSSAFYGCANLTLTSLPSGVTKIKGYAFTKCTGLALTSLPSGVTEIDNNAFDGCTGLALTSLPSGVTMIASKAFNGCTNLALKKIPGSATSIGNGAFAGCTGLEKLEIACAKLGTGTKIFEGCTGLTDVWIRSCCTDITASSASNAPFAGCSDDLKIYAEPASKHNGWGTYFNRTGTSGGTTVTVTYSQTTKPWWDETPVTIPTTRIAAWINTSDKWNSATDTSYSVAVPVESGEKYIIRYMTTDSSLVGTIFRYGFTSSNVASGQTLSQCVRTTPQDTSSAVVTADADYLVMQVSSASMPGLVTSGYLTINKMTQ